jgi:RNA polymerase sigma-70 factor (ECF subfamily)
MSQVEPRLDDLVLPAPGMAGAAGLVPTGMATIMARLAALPATDTRMTTVADAQAEQRLGAALRAGLAGDAGAYHRFLADLSGFLRAFLRRRLAAAPHDVEDVLQETLLAIHNGRHTWNPDRPLKPWIYAITRYKLVDHVRARARHAAALPLDLVEDLLGGTDDEPAQARWDFGHLLEQLPDRHRLPILHVKVQGLSVSETARLTGMSESAVKVGVHRGLKVLAARIRKTP